MKWPLAVALGVLALVAPQAVEFTAAEQNPEPFKYYAPGVMPHPDEKPALEMGVDDRRIFFPFMTFPILVGPKAGAAGKPLRAYANSQVFRHKLDDSNHRSLYAYPWQDTLCESRHKGGPMPACPGASRSHQGVDIRPDAPAVNKFDVVAWADGVVTFVKPSGTSEVNVRYAANNGMECVYLHLQPAAGLRNNKPVKAGETIGKVSNLMSGGGTSIHLHFQCKATHPELRTKMNMPIYTSLVAAYRRQWGLPDGNFDGKLQADPDRELAQGVKPGSTASAPQGGANPDTQGPAPPGPSMPQTAYASRWVQQGSELGLIADGDKRKLVYIRPRADLAGVSANSVLFDGRRDGATFVGEASAYAEGCGVKTYPSSGPVEVDGRGEKRVRLAGKAPIIDLPPGCAVLRNYSEVLLLERIDEQVAGPVPPPAPPAPKPPGQVAAPVGTPPANVPVPSPPGASPPAGGNPPPLMAGQPIDPARIVPVCSRDTCIDRTAFIEGYRPIFDSLNRNRHRKPLNGYQIAALNKAIDIWDTTPGLENLNRLAYILATIWWESDNWIYPTRECECRSNAGSIACSQKLFEKGRASNYYLRDKTTHFSYYGRGQTQLTLKENYRRIGDNLKLDFDLVTDAERALDLDVSARNAVLGLYHGWYKKPTSSSYCRGCMLGLKHIPFTSDQDWVLARDVLIAQLRGAQDVASHARKIARLLKSIPRSDFDARFGAGAQSPAPVPPPAPAPALPPTAASQPHPAPPLPPPAPSQGAVPAGPAASLPPPPPVPTTSQAAPGPTTTTPAADATLIAGLQDASRAIERAAAQLQPPGAEIGRLAATLTGRLDALAILRPASSPAAGEDLLLEQLRREARELGQIGPELETRSSDTARRAAHISAELETLASLRATTVKAPPVDVPRPVPVPPPAATVEKRAAPTAPGATTLARGEPAVDFRLVWPPDHKENAWCRLSDDVSKSAETTSELYEEDLPLRYRAVGPLAPESDDSGRVKGLDDAGPEPVRVLPTAPTALAPDAVDKSALEAQGPSWWQLPMAKPTILSGARTMPLAPEILR